MRLIDADAFMQDINNSIAEMTKLGIMVDGEYLWAKMHDALEHAPSIDIVRCSECKYASDDGTYGCMCEHFNDTSDAYHRMWSDDFCSRGEREGE